MANDQLISSNDPDFFLEYLLRCALTAPGAETSPTAGRILARLLVVGAIEGGDELITPYLGPVPYEDATFEVRTYQPGDLVPTDVREGLRAAAALKIALRAARDSDEGIEVVSRTQSGLERCVLVRDSTGDFEFRFASPETLIGQPAECAAARAAWAALLSSWRSSTPTDAPDVDDAPDVEDQQPAPMARPEEFAARAGLEDRQGLKDEAASGWWVPAAADQGSRTVADAPAPGPPDREPQPAAPRPAETPREEPGDPDWSDPERLVEPPAPVPSRVASDLLVGPPGEPLSGAIRDAIANVVVEVDLGQVEQLIRRALDDDRRELVEPLARRLSARLGETLDLPDTRALVEALSLVVPRPGDLAEAVAADVGALLSETILRRRHGDAGVGVDALHLMNGIEQLQVRMDGLQDQLQKSASLLQAMGDHLEAGDRRAAIAERITTSVDQEMQRLASRIDEQVSALAANAGGGSELADGVARLTRKLRQSVTQFDRALVRLDAMVEQASGDQGRRPAVGRQVDQPAPVRPPRPAGPPGPLGPGHVGPVARR